MAPPKVEGYRIISLVGEGAMGSVYRAREESSGREVALKVLRAAIAADPEYVLRFKREARALAAVRHPGIARFYESGGDGGLVYYSMELVEGEPLSRRIADGVLPVREAFDIASRVADALDAAHRAGILHRDVKPSNLILSPAGPRLTDFGLARPIDGTRLTTSGRVMGSLSYMSPEQIRGEKLSALSDVYSLGIVLFEMLAGKPPFAAAEDAALATRILTEPPPLVSRLRSDLPVGLDLLLIKMLAKDPALRPSSAAEVALAMSELRDGGGALPTADSGAAQRPFSARLAAGCCRAALRLLPAAGALDAVADCVASAASRFSPAAPERSLLDAALARRRAAKAAREMRLLEAKRNERLKRAAVTETRSRASAPDERQSLERLARQMHSEAGIFEQRIKTLVTMIADETQVARGLEERARLSRVGRGPR